MNRELKTTINTLIIGTFLISCSKGNKSSENQTGQAINEELTNPLFEQVSSQKSNIDFANNLVETEKMNIINYHYFYNGGGVAVGDINNDGLLDIFFTANQSPNTLYINKGNLEFEDASHLIPEIKEGLWSTGVTMVDINHDGWLDIYVCRSGNIHPDLRRNLLYINQQGKGFIENAKEYGIDDPAYSTQATFFDYDKDGDLDLFLLNHEIKDISNYNREIRQSGRDPYVGDKLYRNDEGKFKDVSALSGIRSNPYGFGLGVAVGDLNNDGWPDIYVTNDFLENDYLYYNKQNGIFTEAIHRSTKHISTYGMGTDISDFNNDGMQDILVVDMVAKDNFRQKTNMSGMNPERFWQSVKFGFHYQYMFNTLQLNQGNEKFSEVGQMAGISNTDWSWSALMADFDLDGQKDILITNGLRKDVRNNDYVKKHILFAEEKPENRDLSPKQLLEKQLAAIPSVAVPNYIFQNNGTYQFEDKSKEWGISIPSFSNGAVYADLDNDGDLDIIMNNIDEKAFLFENTNNTSTKNNFIQIKLKGTEKNPYGIGTLVRVHSNGQTQSQEIYTTRGFQSAVPAMATFGFGQTDKIDSLEVIWPDGKRNSFINPEVNQLIIVDYNQAKTEYNFSDKKEAPVFYEISKNHNINYLHSENVYDDFKDQILLPHTLSNLGPALAVGDLNGDGLEDFLIGGAHQTATSIYFQNVNGQFDRAITGFPDEHKQYEDVDALFFDVDNDGDLDIYIASGGYEFDDHLSNLYDRIYLNDGKGNFTYVTEILPNVKTNSGCVRAFDYDEDGDLDLFVGGRVVAKKYPYAPMSYLLRNDNGKFTDVTDEIIPEVKRIGMVTSAEWIDFNDDGAFDLIIAGEWIPISVFKAENGKFELMDGASIGLDKSNGWWFSLKKIDYDQDGQMDLVAGNLGLNYKYQASKERPFKVFGSDFDNNQTVDIVLSYEENDEYYPVRGRECSSDQMPFIKDKFPDYESFASSNVYDILGEEKVSNAMELNAYTFATTLFNNNDGVFEAIPMHHSLQLSSFNDILVDDFNKDGIPDLMMAGNLHGSEVETPRNDAGYGNILLGTGDENFQLLHPSLSNYFGEEEVKKIRKIRLANNTYAYLIARNRGHLGLFTFRETIQ